MLRIFIYNSLIKSTDIKQIEIQLIILNNIMKNFQ